MCRLASTSDRHISTICPMLRHSAEAGHATSHNPALKLRQRMPGGDHLQFLLRKWKALPSRVDWVPPLISIPFPPCNDRIETIDNLDFLDANFSCVSYRVGRLQLKDTLTNSRLRRRNSSQAGFDRFRINIHHSMVPNFRAALPAAFTLKTVDVSRPFRAFVCSMLTQDFRPSRSWKSSALYDAASLHISDQAPAFCAAARSNRIDMKKWNKSAPRDAARL